eukprot:GHVS01028912.1.p1 GENE.GHVS01028912.1~~GHVS01028912.1.p1  ORF type:complete len:201 (+),score=15.16 GHVS01028912.1:310-912(+)
MKQKNIKIVTSDKRNDVAYHVIEGLEGAEERRDEREPWTISPTSFVGSGTPFQQAFDDFSKTFRVVLKPSYHPKRITELKTNGYFRCELTEVHGADLTSTWSKRGDVAATKEASSDTSVKGSVKQMLLFDETACEAVKSSVLKNEKCELFVEHEFDFPDASLYVSKRFRVSSQNFGGSKFIDVAVIKPGGRIQRRYKLVE